VKSVRLQSTSGFPVEVTSSLRDRTARRMQADYGLSDEQAALVAPQVEANIRWGMNPVAAGQAAIAKLAAMHREQEQVILGMQANQEAMMGVIRSAMQGLAQMRANNARVNGMLKRVGSGSRTGFFPMIPNN